MKKGVIRQRGGARLAAISTRTHMSTMFSNVRHDRWKFKDLARLDYVSDAHMCRTTMATLLDGMVDDVVGR